MFLNYKNIVQMCKKVLHKAIPFVILIFIKAYLRVSFFWLLNQTNVQKEGIRLLKEEIKGILEQHDIWLKNTNAGTCADLRGTRS